MKRQRSAQNCIIRRFIICKFSSYNISSIFKSGGVRFPGHIIGLRDMKVRAKVWLEHVKTLGDFDINCRVILK
jgi:hypothetical protein